MSHDISGGQDPPGIERGPARGLAENTDLTDPHRLGLGALTGVPYAQRRHSYHTPAPRASI
jgi:hypothetical protein